MAGLSTRPLVRARPYDDSDGFLVDSSAVMDGQLLPLSRSGLFRDDLLVPRFVLDELQGMADANDERSRRAQRGLEILEVLRARGAVARASSLDDEVPEVDEVDAKLVALARKLQLRLLTNDVNLAKVAELQGVPAVIPRRLAADLIPGVLAGETPHRRRSTGRVGTRARASASSTTARWSSSTAARTSSAPARCRSSCRRSCPPARAGWCSPARTIPTADVRAPAGEPEPSRAEPPSRAGRVAPVLTRWRPGRSSLRRARARASAAQAVPDRRRRAARRPRGARPRPRAATAWSSCCPPAPSWDGPPVAAAVAGGRDAGRVGAGRARRGARRARTIVVVHDAARPLAGDALFAAVIDAVRDRRRRRGARARGRRTRSSGSTATGWSRRCRATTSWRCRRRRRSAPAALRAAHAGRRRRHRRRRARRGRGRDGRRRRRASRRT